ncbi:MAG: type II 3-dehydroquinate dehydratase [Alphaproteobacteria bacterium]|nr:type II 3-dehydroquinate dehydratase [Alphaproteobacteria bacterium]
MKISIINGPNLNMLGVREPEIYGTLSLADIEAQCLDQAKKLGIEMSFSQSNHEGEIVELIHAAHEASHDAIVINAAAFTHTSVAILDALKAVNLPIYEVHLSNVHARESFRHQSYISAIATGVICGLGVEGYLAAMRAIVLK